MAELLKVSVHDYVASPSKIKQIQFMSERIDEPATPHTVDMLAALPAEEADFYAEE